MLVHNKVIGTTGNDVIETTNSGANMVNIINANGGSDQFIFKPGQDNVIIQNFTDNSVINLKAFGLTGVDDSRLNITYSGNNTNIVIKDQDIAVNINLDDDISKNNSGNLMF